MSNQLIRTIEVIKDIQWVNQIDHRRAYPSPCPLIQQDAGYITFSNDIPRRFSPGKIFKIQIDLRSLQQVQLILRSCDCDYWNTIG